MRVAFLGTPEAAVPSLEALVRAGHNVALVISQPDRRRGRGTDVSPSPVKVAALRLGLVVADDMSALETLDVDYAIVVAYGALIPGRLLERTPMLNVHFSLLPRWRGAAPVERAILAGDQDTGVGIISLEVTLDTGPLHGERRTDVGEKTSSELIHELARLGAELLIEVLGDADALAHPHPQVGESTYAAKVTPETFHLTPDMSLVQAQRVIRLERAFVRVRERRLRVLGATPTNLAVALGSLRSADGVVALGLADGSLDVVLVQPEGSRAMSGVAWWAGARLDDGVTWD
ncbi:MAG TPA: methionyl-tRNA formyltransferase [Acidimicrobiales bacterium]